MCTSYKPHSEWQKANRCHSDMFNSGATPQRKTDDWLIFTNNIIKLKYFGNLAKWGISFLKCSMFIDVNVSIITSKKKKKQLCRSCLFAGYTWLWIKFLSLTHAANRISTKNSSTNKVVFINMQIARLLTVFIGFCTFYK